jgi:antitoxin CptB
MAVMTPDPFAVTHSGAIAPEDVIRRLRWRARRGLLENDLLLERFFKKWEGRLTVQDHDGLGRLLDLTDNDLLNLLVGRESPEGDLDLPDVRSVLEKIRAD